MLRAVINNPPVAAATATVRAETRLGSTTFGAGSSSGERLSGQADDVQHHAQPAGEGQQQQRDPHDVGVDAVAPSRTAADAEQHPIGRRAGELHAMFDARRGRRAVHAPYRAIEPAAKHQVPTLIRGSPASGFNQGHPRWRRSSRGRTVQPMTNLETEPAPLPPPTPTATATPRPPLGTVRRSDRARRGRRSGSRPGDRSTAHSNRLCRARPVQRRRDPPVRRRSACCSPTRRHRHRRPLSVASPGSSPRSPR